MIKVLLLPALMATLVVSVHAVPALVEGNADIVISNGDTHILTYHKAEVLPPEGASPLYRRSGFIHPLTAPNGGVVTSIHAPDHFHHMGLWHAWVQTRHKGRKLDFWNLKKGQATIRYVETRELRRTDTGVGFTVCQHHVVLPDEVILEELFSVDVQLHPDGHTLVDYRTVQRNVTQDALELPAYRYGGCLAYRGPLHWNNDNSGVLTSEGKSREDGHTTRATWCRFTGPTERGPVGVSIMGHPGNRDAPSASGSGRPARTRGPCSIILFPSRSTPGPWNPAKRPPCATGSCSPPGRPRPGRSNPGTGPIPGRGPRLRGEA